MIFFLALLPATMLTMVGYAVIYLANRSEGGFKAFGKYLGFWAFTLAALVLLASLVCASRGGGMHHMMMRVHGDDMHSWQHGPPSHEPPPDMAAPATEPPAVAPAQK
ncbi:MAG: hypothetical protein ACRES2_01700 [Steroidobacteraceae bacterium]